MKKYFLTDLDGTLLNSDQTITTYTQEVIEEKLSEGHVISYATARSYFSSIKATEKIKWRYPVVVYNGALIFDPVEEKIIDGSFLDNSIADDIIKIGKKQSLIPMLFGLDSFNAEKVYHEKLVNVGDLEFYNSRLNDKRFVEVTKLNCPNKFSTVVLAYIGLKEPLEVLKSKIEKKYKEVHIGLVPDNYIKDHYFLEFANINANKEQGLLKWAKAVACTIEEVTVFGDNLNDIPMFNSSTNKIAVKNAKEELKYLASEITESNDEDGVAKYIKAKTKKEL